MMTRTSAKVRSAQDHSGSRCNAQRNVVLAHRNVPLTFSNVAKMRFWFPTGTAWLVWWWQRVTCVLSPRNGQSHDSQPMTSMQSSGQRYGGIRLELQHRHASSLADRIGCCHVVRRFATICKTCKCGPPQGDEMKKIGMQPIPMMDRDKKDEVPQGQVRVELLYYFHTHGRSGLNLIFSPICDPDLIVIVWTAQTSWNHIQESFKWSF